MDTTPAAMAPRLAASIAARSAPVVGSRPLLLPTEDAVVVCGELPPVLVLLGRPGPPGLTEVPGVPELPGVPGVPVPCRDRAHGTARDTGEIVSTGHAVPDVRQAQARGFPQALRPRMR